MSLRPATKVNVRMVPAVIGAMLLMLLSVMPALQNGSGALAADPVMPPNQGHIDRIDHNNEAVIDDVLFQLNSETRYYSSQGRVISRTEFVQGTIVAYSLIPGSSTVLTLWKTN